ncbi:hypothetical protein ACFPL7_09195 [Dongia soli]|uniref:DUF4136 domain-containing protein n=1 Tax=Dongia soli TaxID=600628 RepID=A0ABU5E9W8_9PROT|nr:hypothetical protein [Dongia soli]MDY0883123.1 hypothetical protein [Dongia soli]
MTGIRLIATFLVLLAAGCTSAPPKPAMAPLGSNGPFGYSEQPIVENRTTITYTGPFRYVSANNPRDDSRLKGELDKTYDLALWRAAQIGQQQGFAAFKVEKEQRDSDVQVSTRPVYYPAPMYAYRPYGYRGFGPHGPWGFYGDYYGTSRSAQARAVVRLYILYSRTFDADTEGLISIPDTLSRMQAKWGSATY